MEHLIAYLSSVDMLYVYAAVFLISFIENIFPPFPSDVVVVFAGSLIAIGTGSGILTVAFATIGSTTGFYAMYRIGNAVDKRVFEHGRVRFISIELVHKVEAWFRRYGYWVIVVNRFLAGTRAVVSFGAGMSQLPLMPTLALSALSALAWNVLLVLAGMTLGANWRNITVYLMRYSKGVSIVIASLVLIWLVRLYIDYRKKRRASTSSGGPQA